MGPSDGMENNINNSLIREATPTDVHALALLHVATFNETHAPVLLNGPTYEIREYQWAFARALGQEDLQELLTEQQYSGA
jgi:hypothetical protein